MKLTNTWKHAQIAVNLAVLVLIVQKLVNLIPNTIFEFGWFAVIVFAMYCIIWEYRQYVAYGQKKYWLYFRGLDTACDLLAGIGSFIAVLWAGGIL